MPSAFVAIKKDDNNKANALLSLVRDSKNKPIDKDWALGKVVRSIERCENSADEPNLLKGVKLVAEIEGWIKERQSGKHAEQSRYTQIIQNIILKSGEEDLPSPKQLEAATKFSRVTLPLAEESMTYDVETGEVYEDD